MLPFFWMPEQAVRKREQRDGVPYGRWAELGFIELSSGNVIDYRDVQARLKRAAEMFNLREICFDPWNSRQISVQMIQDGYTNVEIRQGLATLSEPSKKLLELIVAGKFHHGGHLVLEVECELRRQQGDKRQSDVHQAGEG